MRRRDAIKGLGVAAGALVGSRWLAGCGDDRAPPPPPTFVVVMMENRSYDHLLGARALLEGKPGDGLTAGMANPDGAGGHVAIYRADDLCAGDPPHSWTAARVQWNGGANDGFVVAHRDRHGTDEPPLVMGYLTRAEQPFTWALADAYASCDRWFCSVLGPTFPNRFYLHSGQSGGLVSNEIDAPIGMPGWPTIWHRLEAAGVSWAYYFTDVPFLGLIHGLPAQGRVRRVMPDFFDDAAAGRLPEVVFVDPAFSYNDDHPPHHPMLGQQFLAALYAALAASPQWESSLFAITYDENGGYFDHVPPPLAVDDRADLGFDQLGFRTPAVFAGPYVREGHVSSVVRDHASILAHIERAYGLPPLTARTAAAADLDELLDLDRMARRDPRAPVAMPVVEVDPADVPADCMTSGGGGLPLKSDLELLADQGFFAPGMDRRGERDEVLRAIAARLARLTAG